MMLAQSDTVTLRRFLPSDVPAYQAYRTDPEVGRFQNWALMSDDEASKFLSYMAGVEPLMCRGQWTQIAVTRTGTGTLIGDIGMFLSENGTDAEIGITLARTHHRQGFGSAAIRLGFWLIWARTKAETIHAWADQRNVASIAMLRAVGMSHLGTETNDVIEEAFVLHRPDVR